MRVVRVLLMSAIFAITQIAPALTQVRVEVAPRYGAFVPTGQIYLNRAGTWVGESESGQIAGLSVTTLLSSHWGVELNGLREWGSMRPARGVNCSGRSPLCNSAFPTGQGGLGNSAWLADANVFLTIPIHRTSIAFVLAGGTGAIFRGGAAWDSLEASSPKFSVSYGAGLRIRAGGVGTFRADVLDHVSSCVDTAYRPYFCTTSQHDVVVTTGFSVPLTARGRSR